MAQIIDPAALRFARPSWTAYVWGVATADAPWEPSVVVAVIAAGSPAASAGLVPGDRIVAVDGTPVTTSRALAETLAAGGPERTLRWRTAAGETREAALTARPTIRLPSQRPPVEDAMRLAAWAVADAAYDPAQAAAPLATLAWMLSVHDRPQLAIDVWRRVRLEERAGIGAGTISSYLGRDLERVGRDADAAAAYRLAAASAGTVIDDAGPAVAPAARDRLADLGHRDAAPKR
jgi:hypothetical protein